MNSLKTVIQNQQQLCDNDAPNSIPSNLDTKDSLAYQQSFKIQRTQSQERSLSVQGRRTRAKVYTSNKIPSDFFFDWKDDSTSLNTPPKKQLSDHISIVIRDHSAIKIRNIQEPTPTFKTAEKEIKNQLQAITNGKSQSACANSRFNSHKKNIEGEIENINPSKSMHQYRDYSLFETFKRNFNVIVNNCQNEQNEPNKVINQFRYSSVQSHGNIIFNDQKELLKSCLSQNQHLQQLQQRQISKSQDKMKLFETPIKQPQFKINLEDNNKYQRRQIANYNFRMLKALQNRKINDNLNNNNNNQQQQQSLRQNQLLQNQQSYLGSQQQDLLIQQNQDFPCEAKYTSSGIKQNKYTLKILRQQEIVLPVQNQNAKQERPQLISQPDIKIKRQRKKGLEESKQLLRKNNFMIRQMLPPLLHSKSEQGKRIKLKDKSLDNKEISDKKVKEENSGKQDEQKMDYQNFSFNKQFYSQLVNKIDKRPLSCNENKFKFSEQRNSCDLQSIKL